MTRKTKNSFILFTTVLAVTNFFIAGISFAAESTITISSTSYLAFSEIPSSFVINTSPLEVPIADSTLFSDSAGALPETRSLTVDDNRNSGGFLLQLDAAAFQPTLSTDLRNQLYMVTSAESTKYGAETPVNGVVYLPADGESAFIGSQTVSAPIDVIPTTNTAFDTDTTFTAVSGNILNTTVDVLNGCLTGGGRKGKMNVHTSYMVVVPKYTPPPNSGDYYYSTITFTLSDYTPGSCP